MKKVIIAIPYLTGNGGTETVIKNFAQALDVKNSKNDISWKLISFGGTKYPEWMNGWNKQVFDFSQSRYIQLLAYMFLLPILIYRILKIEQPDFFIATNPIIWSIAYAEKRAFSPKTKIGSWYHYSFKMKNVKKKYLKKADFFWAISSGIKDELVSMGVPVSKITVIYNPVSMSDLSAVHRSNKQNHFIYIGRIDYDGQKNVSELIEAFNELSGDWQCDLYGYVDEETKQKLLKLANKHTAKSIKFKGFYKNVWGHINEADVLMLTSKYEGLPMVLIEAASRGISLVSSNCPMGPEDIVNNKNGFLYKSGNINQLKNILSNIISLKSKLSDSNTVKKSVEKFDYSNFSTKILYDIKYKTERE